jgi:hypothetical protein
MRLPRFRFTISRMMVVVVLVAAILAVPSELKRMAERRLDAQLRSLDQAIRKDILKHPRPLGCPELT